MKSDLNQLSSRLCGCSFIHPGRTLREGFSLVKELGFSRVDVGVGGGNGHFDPAEVAESPEYYAEIVRSEAEAAGLQLNEAFTLNFGTPINSPVAAERERTRALFTGLCRFARSAGFKSVMLIAGPVHDELGAQGSLDSTVAMCNELVPIAQEHGVLLNIEADCESCASTPELADELCRRVPGLGLTLDYSHFLYLHIPIECVALLHRHTRHVHVRQAAPGEIVTDVNAGTIDYDQVLQKLEDVGYEGLYCIEYLSLANDEAVFPQSEARTRAMTEEVDALLKQNPLKQKALNQSFQTEVQAAPVA